MTTSTELQCCSGGCHCGAVRFEVRLPESLEVYRCNCSICAQCDYLHLIVQSTDFELIRGKESLTEYTFNTGTARHLFCRHCGVKSFYVPRSHPDGFSVNVRCINLPRNLAWKIIDFNGRDWSQSAKRLRS